MHAFLELIKENNLADLLIAHQKELHPSDAMEAMQYRALTKKVERNIKEFTMHNVREFGTCIGEESKQMHHRQDDPQVHAIYHHLIASACHWMSAHVAHVA